MNYDDAIIFKKSANKKAKEIARKNGVIIHPRIRQRRLKMDFSNFKEEINKMQNEIEDLQNQMKEKSKALFYEKIAEFFTAYPEIGAIGWDQYTPYFNDGDTCEFSRHDIFFADAEQDNEDWLDNISRVYDLEGLKFSYDSPGKPSKYYYDNPNDKYCAEVIRKYEYYIALGPSRDKEVRDACAAMKTILETIPDRIYLDIFDDHAFILITKDGVDVRECSHD